MRSTFTSILVLSLITPRAFAAFPVYHPEIATSGDQLPIQNAVITADELADVKLEKINEQRAESATNPHPDVPGLNVSIIGDEVKGGPDYNLTEAFDVVAIVNKAPNPNNLPVKEGNPQTLTVYRFKTVNGRRIALKPETYRVSTGREQWSCEYDRADGRFEARWTGTPTGYYTPYLLHPDHHSNSYDDASMYRAVFFNRLGIATHQGNVSSSRQSHGCVRMTPKGSEAMFRYVMQSGVTPDPESSLYKGICPSPEKKSPEQLQACKAAAAARGKQWKALVTNIREQGLNEGLFYSGKPEIPEIAKNGKVIRDEAGQPKMQSRTGYKAVYIVQCRDANGADCSTSQKKLDAGLAALKQRDPRCGDGAPLNAIARGGVPAGRTQPVPTYRPAQPSGGGIGEFFNSIFGGGLQRQQGI